MSNKKEEMKSERFLTMYHDFINRTKIFNPDMKTKDIATKSQYYNSVYLQISR